MPEPSLYVLSPQVSKGRPGRLGEVGLAGGKPRVPSAEFVVFSGEKEVVDCREEQIHGGLIGRGLGRQVEKIGIVRHVFAERRVDPGIQRRALHFRKMNKCRRQVFQVRDQRSKASAIPRIIAFGRLGLGGIGRNRKLKGPTGPGGRPGTPRATNPALHPAAPSTDSSVPHGKGPAFPGFQIRGEDMK